MEEYNLHRAHHHERLRGKKNAASPERVTFDGNSVASETPCKQNLFPYTRPSVGRLPPDSHKGWYTKLSSGYPLLVLHFSFRVRGPAT